MAGESREEGKMKQQHAEFEDEEEGGMQFGFGDDISGMAFIIRNMALIKIIHGRKKRKESLQW